MGETRAVPKNYRLTLGRGSLHALDLPRLAAMAYMAYMAYMAALSTLTTLITLGRELVLLYVLQHQILVKQRARQVLVH